VRRAAVVVLAGVALLVTGCDSDQPEPPKTSTGAAICANTAKPIAVPAEFPADFPLPRGAIAVNTSNSSGGIVLQAISPDGFKDVLKQLQEALPKAGYTLSKGEVEDNDAESNWDSAAHVGRWAIRTIPGCDADTLIQVFAKRR